MYQKTRVARACDQCNVSRTRCDGTIPCGRCHALGHQCLYNRRAKKRGRRSNRAREAFNWNPKRLISDGETGHTISPMASIESGTSLPFASENALQPPGSQEDTSAENNPGISPLGEVSSFFHTFRAEPVPDLTFSSTPSLTGSQDLEPSCRFPVLRPILAALKNILPTSVCCDLLETYFQVPENGLCFTHSPYVLSPVLRKQSVLHQSNPRPTCPAVLATMLWCVAHTADHRVFSAPGSRQRVIEQLFGLVMSLVRKRDMDNWRRVHGGWQLEDTGDSHDTRRTYSTGPEPTVDDVLTFTLLAVVTSGGEYKSDCLKWWNKTVRLVKYLGLHKEPPPSTDNMVKSFEEQEERRRAFWLVYTIDRHLALSHNRSLDILDAECQTFTPPPERVWDTTPELLHARTQGPPTMITGVSFFEYFLPLMANLGDIIELRFRRHHPRLKLDGDEAIAAERIKASLTECSLSLAELASPTYANPRAELVAAYGTYIIKVLYVLLYGEWDAITMLEDSGDWITSPRFSECASCSIDAAHALSEILAVDPELSFMPYLFGIYLFHGSFVLLLFAERMPQLGLNVSVEQACEVIIRAHEVSIVTLSTDFQKTFRKAFRSILYNARHPEGADNQSQVLRKEVLSLYRWTMGENGLCL